MTTKLEDAASIVGEDGALELAKRSNLELLEKSQIEELVTRSLEELKEKDATADEVVVETAVVEDKVNAPKEEKSTMEVKCDDELTAVEPIVRWKPFDGATSLADAQAVVDANMLMSKVYQAYGMFGAVVENIMTAEEEELDVNAKVAALNKAVGEFRALLTPEKLKELSENADVEATEKESAPVKSEMDIIKEGLATLAATVRQLQERPASAPVVEVVAEKSTADGELLEVSQVFNGLVTDALKMQGDERKARLQAIINYVGETFQQMQAETQKSTGVDEVDIQTAVANVVDAKLSAITAQIAKLGEIVQNQQMQLKSATTRTVFEQPPQLPVQKSTQFLPQTRVAVPARGSSIRDIVKITTTGY